MKLIYKDNFLLLLAVLLGIAIGFTNCSADNGETEIIPKTLEQYKLEITQFVVSEKTIVEKCVVGYNKGDFKTSANFDTYKAAYMAVLAAAEAELAKQGITVPEIVAVNKTLSAPGKAFTGNLWISDRRPLNDAIVAADELFLATPEGTEKGQVPATAKTAFNGAITAAKTVRGATATIDRQVTDAVAVLDAARQAFLKAIVK
jgi:hypothetical protein